MKIIRKIAAGLFAATASSLCIYGSAAQMLDKLVEGFVLLIIAGLIWFSGDEDEEKDGGVI